MISLAVIKIKVLNIIGRISELDKVTTALGRTRVFHPDNALSFYPDTTGFTPLNETNPYSKALTTLTDTLRVVGRENELTKIHYPDKASLPVQDWESYSEGFASAVNAFLKEKQDAEKRMHYNDTEIAKLSRFDGLDVNLDELRTCRFVQFRFGSLPQESFEKLAEHSDDPYVVFFPSKEEKGLFWGMYCAPLDHIEEVDRIFSGLYFERVSLDQYSGSIKSAIDGFVRSKQQEAENVNKADTEIQNYWEKEKPNYLGVYTWLTEKYTYYNIRRYAARYGGSFIITGWILADKESAVRRLLNDFETVKYAFDDAEDPEVILHSPPIKLRNKKLWRPFEFFVNVYGLPSYDELDPTMFIAFTYVILFGIMFADLGQGLFIALIGWLLWKKKHSGLGGVMIPCGISSAVFGTILGSVFGFEHALDPLFRLFGFAKKPIEVMEQTTDVVYFAIGLGIFMVFLAILTNVVASLRRKHYTSGLFGPNGVAGLLFYGSVVAGFGGQAVFGWNIVSPVYVVCFMVLPVVSMIFSSVLGGLMEGKPDWKPESWGEMIMQNIFVVFEDILSYLTNTISFIRVGAFVLVHAGMMMVIFKLAGDTVSVGFIVALVVGNAFVIALEGLLSGVQSLRLEFYEMFSRFYDGSGRPYTPVIVGQQETA